MSTSRLPELPKLTIELEDTGIGIEPEFLPLVFDRFPQADSRATRQYGLGLGLAITHHLVEQHGGQIEARSEGSGRGTTIIIRLPASGTARDGEEWHQFAHVTAHNPTIELRLDGVTVLVVDDEQDSREPLAALFERCGADVVRCTSAPEALTQLVSMPVSLMVADIAMPEMDGCELLRRARDIHDGIPAVAVSAYARPEDRQRALTAGYNGYCAKPVEALEFLRIVHSVLSMS